LVKKSAKAADFLTRLLIWNYLKSQHSGTAPAAKAIVQHIANLHSIERHCCNHVNYGVLKGPTFSIMSWYSGT